MSHEPNRGLCHRVLVVVGLVGCLGQDASVGRAQDAAPDEAKPDRPWRAFGAG